MIVLILSPFLVAPLAGLLVSRRPGVASLLAIWPAVLALAFADAFRSALREGPRLLEAAWAPSLGLTLSFHLDGVGLLFALLITVIGALVMFYAGSYLSGHPYIARFYTVLFAFMGAMLGVVLSDNAVALFVFWELTGFTSFLLIGLEHDQQDSRRAALQALIVTGLGGLALLAGALLLWQATGTLSLAEAAAGGTALHGHPLYAAIAILMLLAAFTKSAQVPFQFWLPNAMAAPTPVSAYLHSATMVKAGVYLIARTTPFLGGTALWTTVVTVIGAATMTAGAWRAVQETDLKRVLAYSTVSALGVLVLLLGLGTRASVLAALVYLVAHAGYKGALFLVSGAVDHETGTRDVTQLGGLATSMPLTAAGALLAAASMAGIPLTVGFVGKEAFYEAVLHADGAAVLTGLAVIGSILMGLAALIAGVLPFFGRPGAASAPHEAAAPLWLPPLTLGVAGLIMGLAPGVLNAPMQAAAASILGQQPDVSLALWHGFTVPFALSVVTLIGIAGAYAVHGVFLKGRPLHALGTEWIYTRSVGVLERVSGWIAPPLHSAALRTYVMVILITSVAFIGTALTAGGAARTITVPTAVQVHEVLIAGVIVGGALSAASATSTMTAVLSLGSVGYGVALMFLSFGAPDLAMTQFSVETLTVVIFVLVFRHFRALGALSPRLIRVRDGIVAGSVGLLMGGLVLTVGTSGTPSRLAGYFAEFGPDLGHGRNIVNVILVDFRAFDTLGEITVLATAAIGVRALLRLASAERKSAAAASARTESSS